MRTEGLRACRVSVSTLYRWKALFLAHKGLWLGALEDLAVPQGAFLESMDGLFLHSFYRTFRFSILQRLRGGSGYPPQDGQGSPPGTT